MAGIYNVRNLKLSMGRFLVSYLSFLASKSSVSMWITSASIFAFYLLHFSLSAIANKAFVFYIYTHEQELRHHLFYAFKMGLRDIFSGIISGQRICQNQPGLLCGTSIFMERLFHLS